jgi:hypothetical protein
MDNKELRRLVRQHHAMIEEMKVWWSYNLKALNMISKELEKLQKLSSSQKGTKAELAELQEQFVALQEMMGTRMAHRIQPFSVIEGGADET